MLLVGLLIDEKLKEEFGPVENLRGHRVIWDNASAVAFFVEYNILVCTQCKKSLTNTGITNHIRNSHPEIDSAVGEALEGKYASVLFSPNETLNPPPESCPIPFLPIVSGYSCPLCIYCIPDVYRLVRHLRTVHQSVWSEQACPRAQLQTWYCGNSSRYFSIHDDKRHCCSTSICSDGRINTSQLSMNVESKVESKLEAHMRLLSQYGSFSLDRAFPKNLADSDAYERTPLDAWLEKTKWVEHFHTIELARVVEVREELVKQVQRDGALFMVHNAVGEMLQEGYDLIPEVSEELLFLLRQIKSDEEPNIPFRRPQKKATHKRYVKCWQDFVSFLVFQSADVFSQYHLGMLNLTNTQRDLICQIISYLPNSAGTPSGSPVPAYSHSISLTALIRNLSLACIEQDVWVNCFQSPLLHYLAVLGINENNCAYHDAYSYTGYLASIAYCARLVMIQSCIHLSNESLFANVRLSPCEVFKQQKAKYMMCRKETPMSRILDQLGYGMKIQQQTGGRQLVIYSEEKDELIFSGVSIRVDMIRNLLQQTLSRAKSLLIDSLFLPEDFEETLSSIIPTLRDDTSCGHNGASLASQNPKVVQLMQAQMIKRFLTDAYSPNDSVTTRKIFISGTEKVSPAARFEFEEKRVQFLEYLLLLMHMTGGGPPRGTEMSTLQFANSHVRHRNVFFLAGELLFVTSYHKGQSRYGTQKYIPRFLPDAVGRLLLAYLLYLIPFESIYLAQIFSWPALPVKRTHMLWSSTQGVWDTERLTKVLKRECERSFGTTITTASWRHISIAMMRHWVQNPHGCEDAYGIGYSQDSEDASELQAGHSTEVANLKYACRMDISNTLSSRSIMVFGAVSHDWHAFLKLNRESTGKQVGKTFGQRNLDKGDINTVISSHPAARYKEPMAWSKRKLSDEFCTTNGKRYISQGSY